jgi:DHA3 family macrolide efflux protein-like MFS transporter
MADEVVEVISGVGAERQDAPAARLFNRNFFLLWQGQAVSQLGNQAFALATAFWLLEATGSASLMGLLLAANSLPMFLLSPVGGAFADHFPRIRILVVCDALAGVALLAWSLALHSGLFTVSTLVAMQFATALILGTVAGFFQPAISAAIPDLVPPARLSAANSLSMASLQVSQLLGQGIGGVLYRLFGPVRLFLFDGLSFLFAAGSESLVRMPARPPTERLGLRASVRRFAASIREGFDYVRRTPGLLAFIISPASYNFFTMAVFVLLPFFVRQNLNAGAAASEWYGFLIAIIGLGSIAGFVIAGLVRLTGRARMRFLVVTITFSSSPTIVVGWVHNRAGAMVLAFILGVLLGVINVNLVTLVQSTTPTELRGRVMGVWSSLIGALTPLGMALGGVAGDLTGKNIPLVFTTCGALAAIIMGSTVARRDTREFLARA